LFKKILKNFQLYQHEFKFFCGKRRPQKFKFTLDYKNNCCSRVIVTNFVYVLTTKKAIRAWQRLLSQKCEKRNLSSLLKLYMHKIRFVSQGKQKVKQFVSNFTSKWIMDLLFMSN